MSSSISAFCYIQTIFFVLQMDTGGEATNHLKHLFFAFFRCSHWSIGTKNAQFCPKEVHILFQASSDSMLGSGSIGHNRNPHVEHSSSSRKLIFKLHSHLSEA